MYEANVTFREYRESDYPACESLVENAWEFEENLQPRGLAGVSRYFYTMESVSTSNYRVLAEYNNEVVGFIFGYNERIPRPKHEMQKLSSKLAILKRILFTKGIRLREKIAFLNSLRTHRNNKAALLERERSEIVLFVVHSAFHGKGIGKALFDGFRSFCKKSKVESIIVETTRSGAASFYERIGFKLKGDFASPFRNYYAEYGQACLYEYFFRCER